jgi:hypothetical protein
MRATLRIRMALVPFRMNTYFFDDLCSKLTDELPRLMNIIETSVRHFQIERFLIE